MTKKEFETNELNTRRKLDETNRSRQAVLDRTRDEYEKLLRKYNDLDEVYRELVTIREKDTCKYRAMGSYRARSAFVSRFHLRPGLYLASNLNKTM